MALIALATYCTPENKKDKMLQKTIESIIKTVDLSRHRVIVINNDSISPLFTRYKEENEFNFYAEGITRITLPENIGTARAINKAWERRSEGEYCIKMDDDVVIHEEGWVDKMEEAMRAKPEIGILGLKRKDCWEHPNHESNDFKSELFFANTLGQKWIVCEKVRHVIGTCQMYSPQLLEKIGYLYQPGLYGYDDVLASHRSHIAGFWNCFLPSIEIDHIDPGDTPYQKWKESVSGESGTAPEVRQIIKDYYSGKKSIFQLLY